MTQNQLDIMFDGVPEGLAVCVGIDDVGTGAAEEVLEEVAEDFDGGFSAGESREPHAVHFERHCTGTET